MKKVKQVLSLALAVAMCFALCTPIHAATSEFTGEDALVKIVGTSAEKKLTLDWQLTASKISGTQYILVTYDATRLKLLDCDGKAVTPKASVGGALNNFADDSVFLTNPGTLGSRGVSYTEMGCEDDGRGFLYLSAAPTAASNKFAGGASVLEFYFESVGNVSELTQNDLRYVTAEEAGAHNQASAVNVHVVKDGAYDDDIGYNVSSPAVTWHFQTAPTLTVNGSPLPAGRVELKTITLAASATTATVPTGNTAAEIAAPTMTVTDTGASTDGVKFNLYTAADGNTVYSKTGVTVDTATGKVTVAKTASGSLNDGANKCYLIAKKDAIVSNAIELTITKAAPKATSMTVSATDKTAVYGTAKDITPTFAVKDQYGAAMTGQTITMDAATGFSFDGTKVTVANNATVGNHELTFKCGTASAKLTITVGKANGPAAPSITGENATVKNGNGKLKGTTADMEYSSNNGTSWTTCSATETSVPAGTYIVRVKETATHKAGAATAAITITAPGTSATPTVTVTPAGPIELPEGGSQKLTAAVSGANVNATDCTYVWKKDGTPVDGQTTNELTVTEAGTYTCVVTHTHGSDDPAEGTSNAVVVTVKGKTVVTVAKKATASQTEGALDASKLVTVTGGTWNQVKDAVTATVYEYIPAVEDDPNTTEVDETKAAEYKVVTGNLEGGKTYYVDVDVVAITDKADYKVDAVAGVGAPANTTAPADLTGYVVLTVNKRSSGGGGGGSSTTKYTVTYDAGEHGKLDGSATERVESGKNPAKVPSVVADKGYKFVGWTLNGKSVKPASTKITAATKFVAEYEAADKVTYIQGMDKNHFQPAGNATRGQLATMLARLSKDYDASKTYTGKAPDVENGKWYSNAVNFAINQGIMNGFEDGMFRPTENIRRGEFAAMLARYLGLNTSSKAHFADVTDHWAAGYINALADAGIVDGFEDGTFKAQNLLTRAEAVKMINLAVEMKYDEKADYDNSFVDVAKGAWYYEFVMPAANLDVTDYQR